MKKSILIILVTILAIVCMSSCGKQGDSTDKKKVGIVTWNSEVENTTILETCGLNVNDYEVICFNVPSGAASDVPLDANEVSADDADISYKIETQAATLSSQRECSIIVFQIGDRYRDSAYKYMSENEDITVYVLNADGTEVIDYQEGSGSTEDSTESSEDNSGNTSDLISRGTWVTEDGNGYKVEGEVLTTDLLRATDWDAVQSTYDGMNPSEPLPGFDTISPDGANQDTSVVLVGRIMLNNITDGWDFSESSPYEYKLCIKAPDLYGNNSSSIYIFSERNDLGGVRGDIDTNAVMTSNEGRIPFAIVIPEVFTPNEPDGKESVFNAELQFLSNGASCVFTVPRLSE